MHLITIIILRKVTYQNLPAVNEKLRFSFLTLKSLWRFTGGMFVLSILAFMLHQTDKIILLRVLSLEEYGIYTLAGLLSGSISLMCLPISQAYFPVFSKLFAEGNSLKLNKLFHESAQLVTALLGTIAIIFIFYSKQILILWTQNEQIAEDAYLVLSILSIGNLLNSFVNIPYQIQLAMGWTSFGIIVNLISVVFFLPVAYFMVT